MTICEPRKEQQLSHNFPIISRHNRHHNVCLFHRTREDSHWSSFRSDESGSNEDDSAYTGDKGEEESYLDEVCCSKEGQLLIPIVSY